MRRLSRISITVSVSVLAMGGVGLGVAIWRPWESLRVSPTGERSRHELRTTAGIPAAQAPYMEVDESGGFCRWYGAVSDKTALCSREQTPIHPRTPPISGAEEERSGQPELGREGCAVRKWPRCPTYSTNELVVRLKPGAKPEAVIATLNDKLGRAVSLVSRSARLGYVKIKLPDDVQPARVAKALEADDRVRTSERVCKYYALETSVNDPQFSQQWGLAKIRMPEAWDHETGEASITIAVVDTGVDYDHPDLDSGKVVLGWDYVNSDSNPADDQGHGTHVAGIAAANTNDGTGVAGTAFGCKILAVKVLDSSGAGWSTDIAEGVVYAADSGAKVINLSLGGPGYSEVLHDAVVYARNRGALVVCASGNSGDTTLCYPAAFPESLSVAASNSSDAIAWFSTHNAEVDIAAPGVGIISSVWNDSYATWDGTSMAAPHVSGVAALVFSKYPSLTPEQVIYRLTSTAVDIGDTGWDEYSGYGRVDALRALTESGSLVPVANLIVAPENEAVRLSWTNPPAPDFSGVLIVRRAGAAPTGVPTDGTTYSAGQTLGDGSVVMVGPGSNGTPGALSYWTNSGLTNGTHYYYAVLAHNALVQYSQASTGDAIPVASAKLFVDVTPTQFPAVPRDCWGGTFMDIDGDGDLDIVDIYPHPGSTTRAFKNDGTGHFTSYPEAGLANCCGDHSVVPGDFDRDGWIDLATGCYGGLSRVMRNTGGGAFEDVSVSCGVGNPTKIHGGAFADVDGDGDLDLLFAVDGSDLLYINNGRGVFAEEAGSRGAATAGYSVTIVAADIDGDGDLDLITCGNAGTKVLRNNGTGHFTDVTGASGVSSGISTTACLGDLDNDGDLDLYVSKQGIYTNDGTGHFTLISPDCGITVQHGQACGMVDIDNDGYLDIYDSTKMYRNNGNLTFTDVTTSTGLGLLDVVVTGPGFSEDPQTVTWGDIDGDGDMDVHSCTYLMKNTLDNGKYLIVCPAQSFGTPSHNAKVWIYAAGHLGESAHLLGYRETWQATMRGCGAIPYAHFGLPSNSSVDVRVKFLDGEVKELTGVSRGQKITVRQTPPGIGVTPTALSFTAEIGGSDPASQALSLANTGGEMLVWSAASNRIWLQVSPVAGIRRNGTDTLSVSVSLTASEAWLGPTSVAGAPSPREDFAMTWTGSKVVIWGGNTDYGDNHATNTGGIYDPATDLWEGSTSLTGAPAPRRRPTAVWTGTAVIIWGGYDSTPSKLHYDSGYRYDPYTNTWLGQISSTGAPSARKSHTAVWTGTQMIIWGGSDAAGTCFANGARYNPASNTWSSMTTVNAPSARRDHVAVWTGTEMIVWGGLPPSGGPLKDGAKYTPQTDSWTPIAQAALPRAAARGVWTGTEMIAWGGHDGSNDVNSGERYDPVTNTWKGNISASGAPSARHCHGAVWTGSEMVVWGGYGGNYENTGGRYVPASQLSVGTHTGSIVIRDFRASNNPCSVPVTFTVTGPNTPPVANAQSVSTTEDTAKAITLTGTDPDAGDTLSFTVTSGPSHGALSGTAPNLTYTPAADYNGPDSFKFKVNDGKVDSDEATVSITVTAENDPPEISYSPGTPFTMAAETTQVFEVWATDAESDPLVYGWKLDSATVGTGASTFTYSPVAADAGDHVLEVTVSDGNGGSTTMTWAVKVTVPEPAIELSTTTLAASCRRGTNPTASGFAISNSGGGELSYTITTDAVWLGCLPTSGASNGESDPIAVTYDASALAAGTHVGTITVEAPGATNTPQTVTVTLTVTSGSSAGGGGGCSLAVEALSADAAYGTTLPYLALVVGWLASRRRRRNERP